MVRNQRGFALSGLLALVFLLMFILSFVFGLWAFIERGDLQNNLDKKVADAVTVAVQQAETAKEAEFTEREKTPYRTYTGVATFGSVSFNYPKTWSVYAEEAERSTVLDLFASPGVVPGIDNSQTFALRAEIVSTSYDSVVGGFNSAIERGDVSAQAFRAEAVPSVLGLRVDGTLERDKVGAMIILPLRDKTIKIWTESPEFLNDFNTGVVPSISFIP